ncbi:MAG: endonuclease/exonuclease/phosphatase family protein [Actinophytocola sp.]|uniref:endonuclease/exonuclease/phosphatase family protein n=1 Tax=Actinophytocola sp. TaxID=1872138 RepID=UPI00132B580E|nr:endonuclease/exonuclease/phosphatase family protein [Actinophytocola sp.]MPZ79863.1 endonuclease/exonuclease/phosphatase family protein [Actinophytocola sp.]
MRTLTRLVAMSLALLGFAAPPASAATAPVSTATTTAATTVKVLQLNICHSGVAGCYAGAEPVMAKAVSVISSTTPQVLSVNEACSGDVARLRAAMGDAQAAFVAAQRRDGSPVLCTNGQQYGNIIMVVAALAGGPAVTGRYTAQDDSNEMRVWACIPAGGLSACTTHLSARSGTTALAQCRELMTRAVGYAANGPVVVSGDMNLRYQGSPNVQDCNRSGFYRKGDGSVQHVFATTSLTFVSGRSISMSGTTDHPAWLVTTTMG